MMIKKFFQKNLVILLFSTVFISCFTIKPGAVRAGKNLYETFLSGSGGTTYYIKPLEFKSKSGKSSIDMDFTFRYTKLTGDTAVLKFSIFDQAVIKNVDSMRIESGKTSVSFKQVNHMFSDRAHNQYVNRFSAETQLASLHTLFDNTDWLIIIYRNGKAEIYTPSGKTENNITKLQKFVFAVL